MELQLLDLAALVLAGGQSSRMGQDKALIPWRGQPLLQHVCQAAAVCCPQVYVLTPWPERYQPLIPGDYIWLTETQAGQGPLVALATGLRQMPATWVLLLACDLPQLDAMILQRWADRLAQVTAPTLALVPQQASGWEPLCGFYHRNAGPDLDHFIRQGGRSFQQWLRQLPVQPLAVGPAERAMLQNCNTPLDLEQLNNRGEVTSPLTQI